MNLIDEAEDILLSNRSQKRAKDPMKSSIEDWRIQEKDRLPMISLRRSTDKNLFED